MDNQNLLDEAIYQLTTNYPKHDDMRDGIMLGLESESNDWDWI